MQKFLTVAVTLSAVLAIGACPVNLEATEGKKITMTGSRPSVLSINGFGAVTYIGRAGEATDNIVVRGISAAPNSVVIDGRNYTLAETLVGSGDKPGIATNLATSVITYQYASISGSPNPLQGNIPFFNVGRLVNYFARQANTTITTDTTYNGGAVGGPSNYQIVYVDNAAITLSGNFTGYGVLAIRDRSATGAAPRLIMQDNAIWYGLVIIFQDYVAGITDKTYCSLVGSSGSGGVANLGSYVLIAIDTFSVGNDLAIDSGYIGVSSSSGVFLAGNNMVTSGGGSIIANSIVVGNNATISGSVYRNFLTHGNNFSLAGSDVHPIAFPVFTLPTFPTFSAGTTDITKGNNQTYTLTAGNYRDITFGNSGTLKLTGGIYNIRNLTMGNSAIVEYEDSTSTLRITRNVSMGNTPIFRPKSDSGLNATNLIMYIQGTGGLSLGNSANIQCNLYMPNGTLSVGNSASFIGSFIAKTISAGNCTDTHFNSLSAFGGGSSATIPKIIGGVILQGREFRLPNDNGYNKILYSQAALQNVDNLISTKGYIWEKWQELE